MRCCSFTLPAMASLGPTPYGFIFSRSSDCSWQGQMLEGRGDPDSETCTNPPSRSSQTRSACTSATACQSMNHWSSAQSLHTHLQIDCHSDLIDKHFVVEQLHFSLLIIKKKHSYGCLSIWQWIVKYLLMKFVQIYTKKYSKNVCD